MISSMELSLSLRAKIELETLNMAKVMMVRITMTTKKEKFKNPELSCKASFLPLSSLEVTRR